VAVPPVGVVGLACRFPGAPDADAFARLLEDGRDAITEVPADRWSPAAVAGGSGTTPTRWGGFLPDLDRFDYQRFGLSRREATFMDPQQRLLLENTWEALAHAGFARDDAAFGDGGIFIGIGNADHSSLSFRDLDRLSAYSITGNGLSLAVNRLSNVFRFGGPSVAVDTLCSSSLVAVHLACQSLQSGEIDLAVAGGVNVLLSPAMNVALSQLWMTAADGRCKGFDASADGWVRSEGCGIVVLQRLDRAIASGRRVLAVIKGSAVNHNGGRTGLTSPDCAAQARVIRAALSRADVTPSALDYLEAHGVGSPMADESELAAIGEVFGGSRAREALLVGSVKSNVGNLDWAGGVAALIKVVLSIQRGCIAPHLHLQTPSDGLRALERRVRVPLGAMPWPDAGRARLAGVNSFGFGGTNAHVVVGASPEPAVPAPPRRMEPLDRRECPIAALHTELSPGFRSDPLITRAISLADGSGKIVSEAQIDPDRLSYLRDHRIAGLTLVPGPTLVDCAIATLTQAAEPDAVEIRDIDFLRPLFVPDGEGVRLQCIVTPEARGAWTFAVFAARANRERLWWVRHSTGRVINSTLRIASPISIQAIQARTTAVSSGEEFYAKYADRAGPTLRGLVRVWSGAHEALAEFMTPPAVAAQVGQYQLHPAVAEMSIQVLWEILAARGFDPTRIVARSIGRASYYRPPLPRFWVHGSLQPDPSNRRVTAMLRIADEAGRIVAEVETLVLESIDAGVVEAVEAQAVPVPATALRTLRALPRDERVARIAATLVALLASALGVDPTALAGDAPLNYLGVDSLMAADVRRQIGAAFQVLLPPVEFVRGPSVSELASSIERQLEATLGAPAGSGEPTDRE
jgi:acyl transferase domain-containing protein